VILPNTLQFSGTVTDNVGNNPATVWSKSSGPGTITFTNSQQAGSQGSYTESVTAAFSEPGDYVVQLSVTDGITASTQLQITVKPAQPVGNTQGWIGSPIYGATVSGIVPITLALPPGVSLTSGTLTLSPACNLNYYASNCNNVITLNANTTGSGQIGTLDTTTLPNGTYWIQLQATDNSSTPQQQNSLVMVTVSGNYKPGRVTATVTDLVVPATGLAINIQRSYDSLNAGTSGDFGYGWNLGINVNLTVDSKGDVTFTLGGQRKTFYLAPQQLSCGIVMCSWYFVNFTPEPGLHGTLTTSSPGCASGLDLLSADGFCKDGSQFNPPGYIYTDPNGTSYTISAAGNLQSIQDRSGNGLTITANGITSTTGLNVPFVRDAQNRITQITNPQGNVYQYGYDANGNLATVTYPATPGAATCPGTSATNTSTYSYNANHYYLTGTDGRCNPLPVTAYYDSTNDGGNSSLDGRLKSVTDSSSNTTSYAYTLSTTSTINGQSVPNTGVTTITYPDNNTATMIYDS
jgi:YD repeat-containing protein